MRLSKLILSTFVALTFGAATMDCSLSAQRPTGNAALAENNAEYKELLRYNSILSENIDSLTSVMNDVRNDMRDKQNSGVERTPAERDSISKLIFDLEQHIFDLRDERGTITHHLNSMEQEWAMTQLFEPHGAFIVDFWATKEEMTSDEVTNRSNMIDNSCFVNNLTSDDYSMLRRAHAAENDIREKIEEYLTRYENMRTIADEYMKTDSETVAYTLMEQFEMLRKQNDEVDDDIEALWHEIVDTKQYSYSYILEVYQHNELLDRITDDFAAMHRAYGENEGYYASNAIMHYALGHPVLADTELRVAYTMGLYEAADSLTAVRATHQVPEYRLENLKIERRNFIDYEPIVFGKTSYYNNANPIPQLKVYEYGSIYRILLGSFRSMQNLTVFKGVRPLYIVRENNLYRYYAGGYATRAEADEAEQMLRDKGFRGPQICYWEDGVMTNLSKVDEERPKEAAAAEPESDLRYIVEISADSLGSEIEATIEAVAPGKRISRAGNKFVIGTFIRRSEANSLVEALTAMFTDLEVSIGEIDLNQ